MKDDHTPSETIRFEGDPSVFFGPFKPPREIDPKHQEWIENYIAKHRVVSGMCAAATDEMRRAFPELIRVRGLVETVDSGRHAHWWLLTEDRATIVDPTVSQFKKYGGVYAYWERDETSPNPIGKCMWCGSLIWPDIHQPPQANICSKECEDAYRRDLLL